MKNNKKLILVTGAAGYLGSVIVPHLLQKGYAVRALDNFMFNQTSLLPHFINPDFDCVVGDARDKDTVKRSLENVDCILNLAALVGAPICKQKEKEAWEINYEAAVMLESLRSPGQGYIYPNTTSGYGTHNPVEGPCVEETPQEPISVYGKSKVKAEKELLQKPDVVTYRFTTVYGLSPRLRLDLMPNDFMWRALHGGALVIFEGNFQRSFIHISDVARVVSFTLEHFDEMKGRAFNVGHERNNKTKKELAEKIAEFTGCYLHFTNLREDPDKRNYFISFRRIQDVGFVPDVDWDVGLKSLHAGLKTLHWSNPFANVEYY
ncbi:MAG: SDR family oxidoreductase [Verrucomicrobia bacterium]|nr:SDR family oxidoreductase [Verrucomicrobiota bacterium]